jgi:hypothetical protein
VKQTTVLTAVQFTRAFIQSRRLFFLPRLGAERIGERPRPSLRVAEEPAHKQNTRAVSLTNRPYKYDNQNNQNNQNNENKLTVPAPD